MSRFPREHPTLVGPGFRLRALEERDLPAWVRRLSDTEAAKMVGDPVAAPERVAREGLAHHRQAFRSGTAIRWAIELEGENAAAGSIGIGIDPTARTGSIGAAVDRARWGGGIATAAARLVIAYAFDQLEIDRVVAACLPENERSPRALARLGFTPVSHCPEEERVNGRADTRFHVLDAATFTGGT